VEADTSIWHKSGHFYFALTPELLLAELTGSCEFRIGMPVPRVLLSAPVCRLFSHKLHGLATTLSASEQGAANVFDHCISGVSAFPGPAVLATAPTSRERVSQA
jgi:hypothetical protein